MGLYTQFQLTFPQFAYCGIFLDPSQAIKSLDGRAAFTHRFRLPGQAEEMRYCAPQRCDRKLVRTSFDSGWGK